MTTTRLAWPPAPPSPNPANNFNLGPSETMENWQRLSFLEQWEHWTEDHAEDPEGTIYMTQYAERLANKPFAPIQTVVEAEPEPAHEPESASTDIPTPPDELGLRPIDPSFDIPRKNAASTTRSEKEHYERGEAIHGGVQGRPRSRRPNDRGQVIFRVALQEDMDRMITERAISSGRNKSSVVNAALEMYFNQEARP